MLVGTSPFASADPAQNELEVLQLRILEGALRMPVFVTSSAQSLIRALLAREPEARPTAADVLAHPWVVRLAGPTPREEWE
jgi:serine/threonine protein kinase